jgi:ABC-type multidrug transport system fused ATPase/permease subunit
MSTATNKSKSSKQPEKKVVNNFLVFKKQNYILLVASVLVLVIGFAVMGSGDNLPFDAPIKITVAPIIVILGFALGVFSILYTPKEQNSQDN